MKKFLAVLLTVTTVISVLSVVVLSSAADNVNSDYYVSGDYTYSVLGTTDANIAGYSGTEENLVIPEKLHSYTVSRIGDYAFMMCENITSVDVSDSVIYIGEGAFIGCSSLNKITIFSTECEIFDSEYTIPEQAVIYAYSDSGAHAYAIKYNREFISLGDFSDPEIPTEEPPVETQVPTDEPTTLPTEASPDQPQPTEEPTDAPTLPQVMLGDADNDGEVSVMDASLIQMFLVGKQEIIGEALLAADADKDGDVSVMDASLIQMFLVGRVEIL
ncbi:MAG: leucine-rich repeat protein [Ruminococcus sp.]|nr:leucine-rich repeat protein [Ruminococcus sp.]MBQ7133118.1 leucine-rich repeat protein [Ruminococcus sp.]